MQRLTPWWVEEKAPWAGLFFDRMILSPEDEEERRVQRLRRQMIQNPKGKVGIISSERAKLFTEAYSELEGECPIVRRAKALAHVLRNIPVKIYPDQLVVGLLSSELKGVNIYPEFHSNFLLNEVEIGGKRMTELDALPLRKQSPFKITDEDLKLWKEQLIPYWKDRTHWTYVKKRLNALPENWHHHEYSQIYSQHQERNGLGHSVLDYATVVRKGLRRIREEMLVERGRIDLAKPQALEDLDRWNTYTAMIILAEATMEWGKRYADEATGLAAEETDPKRKKELQEIERICAKVPGEPAESWWEALQSLNLLHLAVHLTDDGPSNGVGRFDQYMYPILRNDLDNGRISRKNAQELLECFWITFSMKFEFLDLQESRVTAGIHSNDKVVLGGVDEHGNDSTNELSFMCLEAQAHVRLNEPAISVRIHRNTPYDFLRAVVEVLRLGGGLPQLINDEVIIPSLCGRGIALQHARNYADLGCQENVIDPNTSGVDSWGRTNGAWYNIVKAIEYGMWNGVNKVNGKQVGPRTGDPRDFKTMNDFLEAVKRQHEYHTRMIATENNLIDWAHATFHPSPYYDLMMPRPRRSGVDVSKGGCKYNWTGPIGVGLATAGDVLTAIYYLIYDKKEITWDQLLKALDANWEGHEELRQKCMRLPKYGNDDDYADRWVRVAAQMWLDAYDQHSNARGGGFYCGFFSMAAYIPFGQWTAATPDGRRNADPLSDSVSPAMGVDTKGPTATLSSAARSIDTLRTTNGIVFNQRFNPNSVMSEPNLNKFIDLIRTYFDLGGQSIQFNFVSRETLLGAQRHPEKYQGLTVRVAGYSARFVELAKDVQDSIIARTEHQI
jgi:formate C-acetyltransferase